MFQCDLSSLGQGITVTRIFLTFQCEYLHYHRLGYSQSSSFYKVLIIEKLIDELLGSTNRR